MSMTFKGLAVPKGTGKLFIRYAEQYYAGAQGDSYTPCIHTAMCGVLPSSCKGCVWNASPDVILEFTSSLLKDPERQAAYKIGTRPRLTPEQRETIRNLRAVCEDIIRVPESNRDYSMIYKAGYTLHRISEALQPLMPQETFELSRVQGMQDPKPWRASAGLSFATGFIIAHLDGELLSSDMLDADAFLSIEEGKRVQYWEVFGETAEEAIVRFVLALSGSELSEQGPFDLLPEEPEEFSATAF